MRCPTLRDLPPPPDGKSGWPWTEESPQLPDAMPDGRHWPRVSLITPSYQQGQFIEETIRSVLLQGYPELEYFIIDGGSTDDSVEIIRKYSQWIAHWVSEPDRGQAHAINKGFIRATGNVIAWINSDDYYLPNALSKVVAAYADRPSDIIAGDVENLYQEDGRVHRISQGNLKPAALVYPWQGRWFASQPGWFIPRSIAILAGPLDERLHYSFDLDLLFRLLNHATAHYLSFVVARFRIHSSAKTTADLPAVLRETSDVCERYAHHIAGANPAHIRSTHELESALIRLSIHPAYARFWNRRIAAKHLASAFYSSPSVLGSPTWWKLSIRLVAPRWFLACCRPLS